MTAPIDISNQRFGQLLAVSPTDERRRKQVIWLCRCDCGAEVLAPTYALRSGNTTSCGCKRITSISSHGLSKKRGYSSWLLMRNRCSDPARMYYYQRGITVCKRWEKFENFFADMGERPVGTTLDRKNNNRGYSPSNCRWASKEEQANNRRSVTKIKHKGMSMSVAQWARKTGIRDDTLRYRLKNGWSIKAALSTPTRVTK